MRKKNLFGNEYEILYDTIRDHDTYAFLRVTLEVDRKMTDRCTVLLNGRLIGVIVTGALDKDLIYKAYRVHPTGDVEIPISEQEMHKCVPIHATTPFLSVGLAAASIISDYV